MIQHHPILSPIANALATVTILAPCHAGRWLARTALPVLRACTQACSSWSAEAAKATGIALLAGLLALATLVAYLGREHGRVAYRDLARWTRTTAAGITSTTAGVALGLWDVMCGVGRYCWAN